MDTYLTWLRHVPFSWMAFYLWPGIIWNASHHTEGHSNCVGPDALGDGQQ